MKIFNGLLKLFKLKRGYSETKSISDVENDLSEKPAETSAAETPLLVVAETGAAEEVPPISDEASEEEEATLVSDEAGVAEEAPPIPDEASAVEEPPIVNEAAVENEKISGKLKSLKNIKNFRHFKKILVTAAVVVLVISGLAVWRFFFYDDTDRPRNEPVAHYVLTDSDDALFQAVRAGNTEEVTRCLLEGGNLDAVNELGVTPIRSAIALDRPDAVREFIRFDRGDILDKPNKADKWRALLVYAVVQNKPQIVKEIMKLPLDVNSFDKNGYTPLLYAIDRNHTAVAAELLYAGADVNARGGDGVTPLIAAVTAGKHKIVAELLKAGADTKALSPSGETAMDIARKSALREVAAGLLAEAEAPPGMTYEEYMHTLSEDMDNEAGGLSI